MYTVNFDDIEQINNTKLIKFLYTHSSSHEGEEKKYYKHVTDFVLNILFLFRSSCSWLFVVAAHLIAFS